MFYKPCLPCFFAHFIPRNPLRPPKPNSNRFSITISSKPHK